MSKSAADLSAAAGYDERGEMLLQAERALDDAWGSRDVATLRRLLADDVVLHADGLVLEQDVQGAEAVARVLGEGYLQRYSFEHDPIARAVDPDTRAAFGFWQDLNLRRGGEEAQLDSGVAGMWKLVLKEDTPMVHQQDVIRHIYMLRQLNAEENSHRLGDEQSLKGTLQDAGRYVHPHLNASAEHNDAMRRAAESFSAVWQTGNTDEIEELLKPDMCSRDMLHGSVTEGRDGFVNMIKKVFQGWQPQASNIDVAVTPNSNKAFVHWSAEGMVKGRSERVEIWGLNLLVLDPEDGRVQEAVGFRQLFPNERESMLKAGPFIDTILKQQ